MLVMHPLWYPLRHYKNVGADTCIFKSMHIQKGGGGKSSNHCRSRVLWERTVRDPNGCCSPEAHSATAKINSELISKQYLQREWFKNGKPDFVHFLPARKLGSYKFTEISNENTTGILPLAEKSKMAMWKGREAGFLTRVGQDWTGLFLSKTKMSSSEYLDVFCAPISAWSYKTKAYQHNFSIFCESSIFLSLSFTKHSLGSVSLSRTLEVRT